MFGDTLDVSHPGVTFLIHEKSTDMSLYIIICQSTGCCEFDPTLVTVATARRHPDLFTVPQKALEMGEICFPGPDAIFNP